MFLAMCGFISTASAQQMLSAPNTTPNVQVKTAWDESMWEAVYEAALVIIIFVISSIAFRVFGVNNRRPEPRRAAQKREAQKQMPEHTGKAQVPCQTSNA